MPKMPASNFLSLAELVDATGLPLQERESVQEAEFLPRQEHLARVVAHPQKWLPNCFLVLAIVQWT